MKKKTIISICVVACLLIASSVFVVINKPLILSVSNTGKTTDSFTAPTAQAAGSIATQMAISKDLQTTVTTASISTSTGISVAATTNAATTTTKPKPVVTTTKKALVTTKKKIKNQATTKKPVTTAPKSASCPLYETTIEGANCATKQQLVNYFNSKGKSPKLNCTIDQLVQYFLEEGAAEGIRGDIAFFQAIKETGFFQFKGDVSWTQNNFCGLGATGGGVAGNVFSTPRVGVRAQIQHLKAYGSTQPLTKICVDTRFSYVQRGIAPRWIDLNTKWAANDTTYGQVILDAYNYALTNF